MTKKLDTEEFKKQVNEVRFWTESYVYPPDEIIIRSDGEKATVTVNSVLRYVDEEYGITQDDWERLIDKLYDDLHVDKWENSYTPSECILDGEQWELRISAAGRRRRIYKGMNAYPRNWRKFTKLMRQFVKERKYEKF